jgi:hypothetical protein
MIRERVHSKLDEIARICTHFDGAAVRSERYAAHRLRLCDMVSTVPETTDPALPKEGQAGW